MDITTAEVERSVDIFKIPGISLSSFNDTTITEAALEVIVTI